MAQWKCVIALITNKVDCPLRVVFFYDTYV